MNPCEKFEPNSWPSDNTNCRNCFMPADRHGPHKHQINEVVSVRSWWWPDNRVVKCRITECWSTHNQMYTVQPLDNPAAHSRAIDEKDIIE